MSQEVVGTAVVVIRAATKDVKKQIREGIKSGFRGTQTDAREAGTKAGVAWGRGFQAGLKTTTMKASIKDAMDETAAASAAGAAAGTAYAAAFKAATANMNPGTPNTADSPTPRPTPAPALPKTPKNTRSTHEVVVRVRDAGLKALTVSLNIVKTTLMGISILSAAAFAGLAGHAAIGGLIGIIGYLSQISGMLLGLPAIANAALAPIAAIGIGVSGIGAAFSAMGKSGTTATDAFADAMAKLSSNARAFVYAIQALGPAWTDMKLSVQDALFQDLGETITTLARVQIPVLKTGLTGIATSLNGIAIELAETFSTPAAAAGLATMLASTRDMLDEMRPGVGALAQAWMNLSLAGAPFLEALGRVFSENMVQFREWTSDTEKMAGFIQRGTDAWLAFWEMSKAVGGVIRSIFGGEGAEAGGRMVARITEIANEFNRFLKSAEGIQALGNYWGGVERAISALAGPMSALVIGAGKLVSVLSDFAVNAAPGLEIGLRGLGDGIESMRPGMQALGTAAGDIFAAMGPLFQQLGPALSDILVSIAPLLREIALAFIAVLQALIPLLPPLVGVLAPILTQIVSLITDNPNLFAGFVVGLGALAAGLKLFGPLLAIIKGVKAAITGLKIAWLLLQIAFAVSPIGVVFTGIIAAGVALWAFFTKTETGRKLWTKIWDGIKTAFTAVWEGVLKPAWEGMKIAWDGLVTGMKWAWDTILKPVWDGIVIGAQWLAGILLTALIAPVMVAWNLMSAAFRLAWETVLQPVFQGIGAIATWLWQNVLLPAWEGIKVGFESVGVVFQWVYETILQPVFNGIGTVAMWLWNNVLTPFYVGVKVGFQSVGTFFQWVYNSILKPVFNGVAAVATWLWQNVLTPAWEGIKAGFRAVGDFFKWVFDSIIKPVWDALGNAVSWVIDNVAKPAFDRLKDGLSSVGDFFSRTVDGIKTVWDRLKGFLATPINFLIDTVWNNGLLQAWETVRKFLPGLPKAERLSPIAFADGGPVPFVRGAKRGKDSVHGLLMPGEHVLTEEEVRAMGGHRNVYAWRESLRTGFNPRKHGGESLIPQANRYAKGGRVKGKDDNTPDSGVRLSPTPGEGGLQNIAKLAKRLIHRIWPDITTIGGYRQDPYPEHPSGRALDVMVGTGKLQPLGDEVTGWALANDPTLPVQHTLWKQTVWMPGGATQPMGDRGSPTQNHMDHPHIWYKPKDVNPNVVPEGLVGHDGLTSADRMSKIKEKIQEILDKSLDPLRAGMGAVIGDPPPHYLGIPPESLDKTKEAAVNKSFEFVEGMTEGLKEAYDKAREVKDIVVTTIKGVGGKIAGPFLRDTGGFIPNGLSIVRNETGAPEAVLNWEQLQALKQTLAEAGIRADELGAVKQFLSTSGLSMGAEADVETMMKMPPTDFGGIWAETMNAASISFMSELGEMVGLGKSGEKLIKPIDVVDESGRRIVKGGESASDLGPNVLSDSPTGAAGNAQQLSGGVVPVYGDPSVAVTSEKVTLKTNMPDLSGGGSFQATGNSMDYVKVIKDIAEGMGLGRAGAKIGVATGIVESNIKILANRAVPESLKYPHDGIGGDHDSVGIFQQRQAGWGTLAQRMSADGSAKLFFNKLQTFNWRGMDPGAAAQKVQVSAFPLKYGQKMGEADRLLATLYDTGGVWKHGTLGLNLSGADEMVLKDRQWRTAEGALNQVIRAGRDSDLNTGRGYSQSVHNPSQMAETVIFQGMDERKTFEEWDRYQRQNMAPVLSGRYRGGN